ncbi:MAG: hypothetical protein U0872_05270 [Planctomycetaceae bacterium]
MSVKVKCPECAKLLTVPDAARGKAIKCPNCQTRIAVPADEEATAATAKSGKSKSKSKEKRSSPVEDEAGLATLDLRKAIDHEARVCPKCGYDMSLLDDEDSDEEITECPQCGWDTAEGGIGEKARKKQLKGPDPDKFYVGLWKNSWKFVSNNLMLSIRTFLYTGLASLILFVSLFMYLYNSMWPPRIFFALVAFISAMVIPGWFWYLDTEVIKLTLERRDKFKRLNFDFFLASALGVKLIVWNVVFAGPLLLAPGIIVWLQYQMLGPVFSTLILAIFYVPIFMMWPIVLTHMTMPVTTPGWLFWKVIPMAQRCLKPLIVWFSLFMVTNLPVLLIGGLTAVFTAGNIVEYARIMDRTSEINRATTIWQGYEGKKTGRPKELVDPAKLEKPPNLAARHYISLGVAAFAWVVCCVILAFTGLFNMRTNGYFSYYFRERLDVVVLQKEYKYVATLPREDQKHKRKEIPQILGEVALTSLVITLIGVIGGMLYGTLSDIGVAKGVTWGIFFGGALTAGGASIGLRKVAFDVSPVWGLLIFFSPFMLGIPSIIFLIQEWEDGRQYFFQWLLGLLLMTVMWPILIIIGASPWQGIPAQFPSAPPAQEAPAGANP